MNQNTEPNRCLKCRQEIEPQYYYCEKCADKRMKWQFSLTLFISAIILLVSTIIYIYSKPHVSELIYESISLFASDKLTISDETIINAVFFVIYSSIYFALTFGLISFVWTKFKYADSKLRDIPEETKDSTKKFISNKDKICFCRKCGEKLVDGNRFCNKCGTEILNV